MLMFKALAFGLGAGAGIQAWRNFPPDGPLTARSVAVVFVFGVLFAYLAGRWHTRGRSSATATATASAEASATAVNSNTVQLAVVVPGGGARPYGVQMPTDAAPWLLGASERSAVTVDDLDGMDLAELVEEPAAEVVE